MTRFEARLLLRGKIPDDSDERRVVESSPAGTRGSRPPGDRPESAVRRRHQDPHQRRPRPSITTTPSAPILKFQLHDHIAREILKEDPRECNYFGNKKVGDFLKSILRLGATRDWNAVLNDATGQGLTAKPMVAYFEPLLGWLREQNKGREVGWS